MAFLSWEYRCAYPLPTPINTTHPPFTHPPLINPYPLVPPNLINPYPLPIPPDLINPIPSDLTNPYPLPIPSDSINLYPLPIPSGSLLDKDSNTFHLSPIFLWFVKDFEPYNGVLSFVSSYLPSDEVKFITQMKPTIKYFSYNWNINGVPPCKC